MDCNGGELGEKWVGVVMRESLVRSGLGVAMKEI